MQLSFWAPITNEERINQLRKEISEYDLLEQKNASAISDTEYDKLYKELLQLEIAHPECYSEDSPTQKITYVKVPGLQEEKHPVKMLSLGKINTTSELHQFYKDYPYELIGEWKEDGGTIVLTYDKGTLISAITLGNGEVGQNILHNMVAIKTVPKTIPYQDKVTLRGECIIPYAEFDAINMNGEYKNPRNLACASFTMLDSKETATRGLKFILFDVITDIEGIETEEQALLWGQQQGFTIDEYRIIHTEDELIAFIDEYEHKKRPLLDHQVDGAVIKINNRALRKQQGVTQKYPKGSIAYKFVATEEKTKVLDIIWSIGKSGQLCPNAVLEPVDIEGFTVSAATLHNWKSLQEKDIRIGDMVSVKRANDVIPHVVAAYKEERTGKEITPLLPQKCPLCGGQVAFEGEHLFCKNELCESQLVAKLQHFISKEAMNMKSFGDETLFQFYQLGFVRSYKDIFHLKEVRSKLLKLNGFGEKKVAKILNSIEAAKATTIHQFLYSLSIKWIGEKASKQIEAEFKTIDALFEAYKNGSLSTILFNLPDVGPAIVNSLLEFLSKNLSIMQELIAEGITFKEVSTTNIDMSTVISGKTFVITGDIYHFTNRNELKSFIEARGGKVTGSVSKNTDYLISNENDSSSIKAQKAHSLNVAIITEDEFLDLLNQ